MKSKFRLFAHVVWGTWQRRPLIDHSTEESVYRSILAKCHGLACQAWAIGGTDQVHMLVRFQPLITIARLVGEMKGASSHAAAHELAPEFRWQPGYGAFTLSEEDAPSVVSYVRGSETPPCNAAAAPDPGSDSAVDLGQHRPSFH